MKKDFSNHFTWRDALVLLGIWLLWGGVCFFVRLWLNADWWIIGIAAILVALFMSAYQIGLTLNQYYISEANVLTIKEYMGLFAPPLAIDIPLSTIIDIKVYKGWLPLWTTIILVFPNNQRKYLHCNSKETDLSKELLKCKHFDINEHKVIWKDFVCNLMQWR